MRVSVATIRPTARAFAAGCEGATAKLDQNQDAFKLFQYSARTSCKSEAVEQGSLELVLAWDGQRVVRARVVSTRLTADRLLRGLPAVRVPEVIVRLFSLCRAAQSTAARLAVQAARCRPTTSHERTSLALAVACETIAEHLTHFLVAWPQADAAPHACRTSDLATWRRRLQAVDDPAAAAHLSAALEHWLTDLELPCCADMRAADACPLLPRISPTDWGRCVIDDDFARRPTFAGAPAETGALARQHGAAEVAALLAVGRRVDARLVARAIELRRLVRGLAEPGSLAPLFEATMIDEGSALACVETARGTLLHRVQLEGERIARYVIVAPTEWNFHPQGPFVREISGFPATSEDSARHAADRLALALDPCAACTVKVEHA